MEERFENPVLSTDQLPQIDAQDFQVMPPRYRTFRWSVFGSVGCVALLAWVVPLGFLQWYHPEDISWLGWCIPGGVTAVIFGVCGLEEWKGFGRRGYLVRERDLSYRSGWFFRGQTTVPYTRIQHSEVSQGPIARKFRICTLKLYTAGSSGANLRIPGLDSEVAETLRTLIDERSGK